MNKILYLYFFSIILRACKVDVEIELIKKTDLSFTLVYKENIQKTNKIFNVFDKNIDFTVDKSVKQFDISLNAMNPINKS